MFLTNPFNYRKTVRLSVAKKAYDIDTKPVGLRRTFRLAVSPASMSISGQTAGLRAARRIVAGLRTLAISPVSSRLLRGRKIAAAPAAFAITGRSVNVYKSRVAGFVLTTFAIDGKSVALKKNYVIRAQPASMAVSMKSVGMLKVAGQLAALPLGMSVAAQSIMLRAARKLTVTNATYVMTGQQQRLLRTYPLNASPAALSISGKSALLKVSRKIVVVKADWVFAQPSVTMTHSVNSSIEFVSSIDLPASTTYTFSAYPYGANHQLLVIAIVGRTSSGNPREISNVTVDGSPATVVATRNAISNAIAEIWQIEGPANASGNIVVTMSSSFQQLGIAVYRLNGLSSTTAKATAVAGDGNAASRNANLNMEVGDVAVGCFVVNNGTLRTVTWSGLNEDYDAGLQGGSNTRSGASYKATAAESPRIISATASSTVNNTSIASAVWG